MADKFEVEFSRNLHKEITEVTEGEEVFIYYRSEKVDSRLRGNDKKGAGHFVISIISKTSIHYSRIKPFVIPAQAGIHTGLEA